MKDFLENIIKNIVEHPDQVSITEESEEGKVNLTIHVADDDMGRVIGKEGKVINSIRMILRIMAIRQDVRVRVDIEDKQEKEAQQEVPAPAAQDVQPAEVSSQEVPVEPAPVVEAPIAPAPVAPPVQPVAPQPQAATPTDLVGAPAAETTLIDNSGN